MCRNNNGLRIDNFTLFSQKLQLLACMLPAHDTNEIMIERFLNNLLCDQWYILFSFWNCGNDFDILQNNSWCKNFFD